MKNPRTLQEFKDHPWVADVSDEREAGHGIWVYLKKHERPMYGCHSYREDTVRELAKVWREEPPVPCGDVENGAFADCHLGREEGR